MATIKWSNNYGEERELNLLRATALTLGGLAAAFILTMLLIFGTVWISKGISRYQKRADANNRVKVTNINIRNANQEAQVRRAQVEVTKAEAEQRYQESIGIRRSQDEIAKTLTPLYVQHEAIKAQEKMANSESHTQVYVPVGPQGIPLVKTTP